MENDDIRQKPDQSENDERRRRFEEKMSSLNAAYPQLKTTKPASQRRKRKPGESAKADRTESRARREKGLEKAGGEPLEKTSLQTRKGEQAVRRRRPEGNAEDTRRRRPADRADGSAQQTGMSEKRVRRSRAEEGAESAQRRRRPEGNAEDTRRRRPEDRADGSRHPTGMPEERVRRSRTEASAERRADGRRVSAAGKRRKSPQYEVKEKDLDSFTARNAWTEADEIAFRERDDERRIQREKRAEQRRKEVQMRKIVTVAVILLVALLGSLSVRLVVTKVSQISAQKEATAGGADTDQSLGIASDSSVTSSETGMTDEEKDAIIAASSFSAIANEDDGNTDDSGERTPKYDAKLDEKITAGSRTTADGVQVGIAWTGNMINSDSIPMIEYLFYQAIIQAGGEPVFLEKVTDEATAIQALDSIDCLVVCGGTDIDPSLYGEKAGKYFEGPAYAERDTSDYWIMDVAIRSDIPVMAVCRGMQMMNIIYGGSLVQDISQEIGNSVLHRSESGTDYTSHDITIEENTLLWGLEMTSRKTVNSFHHECVKELGDGLLVSARADDGVIEAIEDEEREFVLGLQYHPEKAISNGETSYLFYFQAMIAAAS